MLNKVILFVAKFAIGKHLVGAVAGLNNALSGHRSEILLGVLAVVEILKFGGVIPPAIADTAEASLLSALPVTLAEKFSKAKATIDAVVPAPKPEA